MFRDCNQAVKSDVEEGCFQSLNEALREIEQEVRNRSERERERDGRGYWEQCQNLLLCKQREFGANLSMANVQSTRKKKPKEM